MIFGLFLLFRPEVREFYNLEKMWLAEPCGRPAQRTKPVLCTFDPRALFLWCVRISWVCASSGRRAQHIQPNFHALPRRIFTT